MKVTLDPAKTAVLCCTSLAGFLTEAQKRAETAFPVFYLDRKLHVDPKRMREAVLEALGAMPGEISTVLVAMGFCGGSWEDVPCGRLRIVTPAVDDCISLLLTTDDREQFNRKDDTHLYLKDPDPKEASFKALFDRYTADKPAEVAEEIHARWKELFRGVDIVDAGVYDTHTARYEAVAAEDAAFLDVPWAHVPGSVLLLEKMLRGDWDGQFRVWQPGTVVRKPEPYFVCSEEALDALKRKDKKLGAVIDRIGPLYRPIDTDLFESVVHQIVGQQISTKAQKTIWARMQSALGEVTPQTIASAAPEDLQQLGLTFRKVGYMQDFARKVLDGSFDLDAVQHMGDEEAIAALVSLKGIGVWTAEMLLLFCLQRLDVLSFGDLAILRGMRMVYRQRKIDRQLFEKYRRRLSPFGSVASLYFWAVAGGAIPELSDPGAKKK